jgi:hypothetical protein
MADIGKRLAETTLNARSGAYRWLRRNHAEIAAVFATLTQPSWSALAATAAGDGEDFTPNALRKAWLRLERDLARLGAAEAQKPGQTVAQPAVVPETIASRPTRTPPPEASKTTPTDPRDDDNPYGFGFASEWKPKNK